MCFKLLLAYLQPVVATPLRHLEECRGYFIGSKLTGIVCLDQLIAWLLVSVLAMFSCAWLRRLSPHPVFCLFCPLSLSLLVSYVTSTQSDWIVTDTWIIEPWQWSLLGSSRQCVRVITTFDSVHPVTVKKLRHRSDTWIPCIHLSYPPLLSDLLCLEVSVRLCGGRQSLVIVT